MIKAFRRKDLKRFFESGRMKGVPADLSGRLRYRLDVLNRAKVLGDLNLPGYELHELKGDRRGFYAVKVSANYRLTFRFKNGDAFDVNLEDYH